METTRRDGRMARQLREVKIVPSVSPYAEGSAEVSFGATKVLVTASVEREIPPWMKEGAGGWITAEYGMLPRSTHTRNRREAASGRQGGRTMEIQRLIGRSLRAAVNLTELSDITVRCDCDVLCADGGTRTAAISGGWVALYEALRWAMAQGILNSDLKIFHIAAVSVGIVDAYPCLDLCYEEDSRADFDLNLVFNEGSEIIEIQGTGERSALSREQLDALVSLGLEGAKQIFEAQRKAIASIG